MAWSGVRVQCSTYRWRQLSFKPNTIEERPGKPDAKDIILINSFLFYTSRSSINCVTTLYLQLMNRVQKICKQTFPSDLIKWKVNLTCETSHYNKSAHQKTSEVSSMSHVLDQGILPRIPRKLCTASNKWVASVGSPSNWLIITLKFTGTYHVIKTFRIPIWWLLHFYQRHPSREYMDPIECSSEPIHHPTGFSVLTT